MKHNVWFTVFLSLFLSNIVTAHYGHNFCNQEGFTCIKVKKGQSWQSLWPDPYQRDIVKRLNRINIRLFSGITLAVPDNLSSLEANDIAPFAKQIESFGSKTIIVSPAALAWGAYTSDGQLLKWGPISPGKDYCPDIGRSCHSKTGTYSVYEKRGADCVSTKFPIDKETGVVGGAPMPYCMFYYGGFALHGSPELPGYAASHGCIRLFTEDARWLNREFTSGEGKTTVIVLPYSTPGSSVEETAD